MSRARLVAAVIMFALAGPELYRGALSELGRRLPEPDSLSRFAGLPGSLYSPDAGERRLGPVDRVTRIGYPEQWLGLSGAISPLVVFVGETRAIWLVEEPDFAALSQEETYAYMRLPGGQSIFVACPSPGCGSITLVRDHLATRLALAQGTRGLLPGFLILAGLSALLLVALTLWVSKSFSPAALVLTILTLVLWLVLDRPAGRLKPLFPSALLLGIAVAPVLLRTFRWVRSLARRALSGEPSRSAGAFRVFLFFLTAVLAAVPGLSTVSSWHPSEFDDSQFYMFAASRFLRTQDLLGAALDPSNWRYSAYPLMLAVFAKINGLHPMEAYKVTAVLGPIALAGAAGVFAWMTTGRYATGLLATLISGLWGGLGGYAWLAHQASEIAGGRGLRLIETDYYEARYFGEFTGPYSEITAYLQSAPFFPREVGLVPFWLGLGLLYRRLRGTPSSPSLVPILGLFILATAIYPYFGMVAPLALLIAGFSEGVGDDSMKRRRRGTFGALVLLSLVCWVVGDMASRWYRGDSAFAYIYFFLFKAPLSLNSPTPSLDFLMPRLLSGEFFFGIAFAAAVVAAWRPEGSLSQVQRRAALATLALCTVHGLLNEAGPRLHLVMKNFRWFNSWRALLTPLMVLAAALVLERLFQRVSPKMRPAVVLLALIPTLSPIVWAVSGRAHLERPPYWRGLTAPAWVAYREHGRQLLGKVSLVEPLVIEGATVGEGSMAMAAFGVVVLEAPSHPGLFAEGGKELISRLESGELGSVALRVGGELSGRIEASTCCTLLTSFGDYRVYVRRSKTPQATEKP